VNPLATLPVYTEEESITLRRALSYYRRAIGSATARQLADRLSEGECPPPVPEKAAGQVTQGNPA